MSLCTTRDDNIAVFLSTHVVPVRAQEEFLNNCGGYFNMGYDNNAIPNNKRKRGLARSWINMSLK